MGGLSRACSEHRIAFALASDRNRLQPCVWYRKCAGICPNANFVTGAVFGDFPLVRAFALF